MSERNRGSGSAGRFGPRYGRVSRRRVSEIEGEMRDDHACPECGAERVSRVGTGLWECSRCDHTFAGGAYRPETPAGRTVRRSLRAALSEGESPVDVDLEEVTDEESDETGFDYELEGSEQ